jgi:glycosyltransferase involved in cell wall biosynthesis
MDLTLLELDRRIYLTPIPHSAWSCYSALPPVEYTKNASTASLVHYLNRFPQTQSEFDRPFILEFEHLLIPTLHTRDYVRALECLPFIQFMVAHPNCKAILAATTGALLWAAKYCPTILSKSRKLLPSVTARSVSLTRRSARQISPLKPLQLLNIGNKFWGKGTHLLIDIFKLVKASLGDSVVLTIVCDDYPADYEVPDGIVLIRDTLLAPQKKAALYGNADLFVFPCLHDSMGVFLECIEHSLPILTTSIYDKNEMIIEGVTGFLFRSPLELYGPGYGTSWKNWDEFLNIVQEFHRFGVFRELAENMAAKVIELAINPDLLNTLRENIEANQKIEFNHIHRNLKMREIYSAAVKA